MAPKIGLVTIEAGIDPGRRFVIRVGEKFSVGRDKKANTYGVPTATSISREHCYIENKGGVLSITDLGSKNGTLVNGKTVESRALRDNDEVEVGRIRFRVNILDREPDEEEKGPKGEKAIFEAPMPPVRPEPKEEPAVIPPKPGNIPEPAVAESAKFSKRDLELVGQVVGSYKILSAVAVSPRGIIYKAHEPSKNRLVAMKLLNRNLAGSPEGVAWFTQGAKRSGALRHENIVPIVGGGRLGDTYYVSSLFMARGSAEARFRRAPKEGIELVKAALQAAIQVVRALEFGFQEQVLHLGVRPSKILFDERRRVRLNDMGFNNGPGPGFDMQSSRADYLAPEQKKNPKSADFKADVFGLGGSFYYMLTGRAPERSPRGVLTPPCHINRVVPESLCRIVEKMLEPDPAKRYDSYGHLLHDLRWALRGEVWPKHR